MCVKFCSAVSTTVFVTLPRQDPGSQPESVLHSTDEMTSLPDSVPMVGLEPTRPKTLVPKTSASAISPHRQEEGNRGFPFVVTLSYTMLFRLVNPKSELQHVSCLASIPDARQAVQSREFPL